MKKRIISFVLSLSLLFGFTVSAYASDTEEFLSEVALIYRDSAEEALAAIAGTDWKLYDKDLNPNADYLLDDGVYLIYKTSTNVEDAITDLRVMDMYGGYSASKYTEQLEKSRDTYRAIAASLGTTLAEFKSLYTAGDEMAAIAYRQMNYYKDIGETELLMGDFMLSAPSEEALVRVLMEGNAIVGVNLISLLVIGISGNGAGSLAERIADLYGKKDTLTADACHEGAVVISEQLEILRDSILRCDALAEEFDVSDEEMSDEEYTFVTEYMATAEALANITLGDINLADFIRRGEWALTELYPIAAALSPGQLALTDLGQLDSIIKYGAPSKPIAELEAILDRLEAEMKDENGNLTPIDVYLGVDRTVFSGTFAMTNEAERQQALTGETWDWEATKGETEKLTLATMGVIAGETLICVAAKGILYGLEKYYISKGLAYIAALNGRYMLCQKKLGLIRKLLLPNLPKLYAVATGIGLVMLGVNGVMLWYNYYNPDYTEIPDVMIDVRETELGDKYVKYNAAKVFGEENKNADFNAYEGKEWNALYYTKDAAAGNCLTPNFVCREDNAAVSRRHQGISMFGETDAFNLNSHVYHDGAVGVYLTVRYSTAQKEAAALPEVVGSMIGSNGYYALTAAAGLLVGIGIMAIVQAAVRRKKPEAAGQL